MQQLNDVLNANIEAVRTGVLPVIYQLQEDLAVQRVMKNTESYRITKTTNADDFRAPLKTAPAGKFGGANLDGGNLGLGRGFAVAQLVQSYFSVKMGFQMTWASVEGTQTTDQSRVNVFKETMKDGVPNMARCENVTWHNIDGNGGRIGLITSAGTTSGGNCTVTMDSEWATRLLLENLDVEIFSNDLSTQRTSSVTPDSLPYVQSINRSSRQVVLTNMGSIQPQANDFLYLGACGSTPTWADGLYYVNTTATSGSYLGLSRSTYPQINPSSITNAGTLDAQAILALKQLIKVRSGSYPKVIGLAAPHQIAMMSQQVQTMQMYLRSQVTQKQIDPLPQIMQNSGDGVLFGDVTHYQDDMQANDRIDYCDPETWGRVYLNKPGADFYRDPGTNQMFFPMTATSTNAGYAAGTLLYLVSTLNYYNVNPMRNGLITGLATPSSNYTF